MKLNPILLLSLFVALAMNSTAQPVVEMADTMRAEGKIYVVVAVLSTVFVGLAAYLFFLDRRVSKLEKK